MNFESLFAFDLASMTVMTVLGIILLVVAIFPNNNKPLYWGLSLALGTMTFRIGETTFWQDKGPQLQNYQGWLYLLVGAFASVLLAIGLFRVLSRAFSRAVEDTSKKKFSEKSFVDHLANWERSAKKAEKEFPDEVTAPSTYLHKLPEYRRVEIEEVIRGRKATDDDDGVQKCAIGPKRIGQEAKDPYR